MNTSKKIVCLGDSLTQGYNIKTTQNWVYLLNNDLNHEVLNFGISGDTTNGMLNRLPEIIKEIKPDVLIVLGGTNDLSLNITEEIIIGNLLAITGHAKFNNILPILGIISPFYNENCQLTESIFISHQNYANRILAFQKKLIEFAKYDNQIYIDFSKKMSREMFLEDGLHPTEKGNVQMKNNALPVLKNYYTHLLFNTQLHFSSHYQCSIIWFVTSRKIK